MGLTHGSLSVVGIGFVAPGQTTPEAEALIRGADKVLLGTSDALGLHWIRSLNSDCESLFVHYDEGKSRRQTYDEMVESILRPLRQGLLVCAVFYGHPGVFVTPGHEAVRRARDEGFSARMFPGIGADSALYADLGVDPGQPGCQIFEATQFLVHSPRFDPRFHLILLQIGSIGVQTHRPTNEIWNPKGLHVLVEALQETYPPTHEVIVYEASTLPISDPVMLRVPLAELTKARVTLASTLYVSPLPLGEPDPSMLGKLRESGTQR